MNINTLSNLNVQNTDLINLVGYRAELKLLDVSFQELSLDVPYWIGDKCREIEHHVELLVFSERQATLKKLQARRAALQTREEKSKSLDSEIEALEALTKR